MRLAIGERGISFLPAALRRAFSSMSAMSKNGRRACDLSRALDKSYLRRCFSRFTSAQSPRSERTSGIQKDCLVRRGNAAFR
jgi:hypothetical protein